MPEESSTTEPPDLPENLEELSFEDAMEALESLVRGMESNRIPINDLIEGYEKGTELYRICQKRLDEARGRIELIRRRSDGEADLEPFEEGEPIAETQTQATFQDGELF